MPKVNRAAQLLAEGQPIYNGPSGGRDYEAGKKAAGTWDVAFLSGVYAREVEERIKEGVMICSNRDGAVTAERGRKFTNRTMPW